MRISRFRQQPSKREIQARTQVIKAGKTPKTIFHATEIGKIKDNHKTEEMIEGLNTKRDEAEYIVTAGGEVVRDERDKSFAPAKVEKKIKSWFTPYKDKRK